MCGRFVLTNPPRAVADLFGVEPPGDEQDPDLPLDVSPLDISIDPWAPRYNIAPTQDVLVARVEPESSGIEVLPMRWGLVPFWAKDIREGARMINARAETAANKPAFRKPFRGRRCLIPADGFYEWRKLDKKRKQPHLIRLKSHSAFALAGLWAKWRSPDQGTILSVTILTTAPNPLVAPLHDRMPVILPAAEHERWLDPGLSDPDALLPLLKAYPAREMEAFPVSDRVNRYENDDAECLQPVAQMDLFQA